jgi:hypothetical protein
MTMNLKASFVDHLIQKYPHLRPEMLQNLVAETLLSPFQIPLSKPILENIKTEIKKYWKLRQWGVENLSERYDRLGLRKPENFGVCMSYDFHLSSTNQLELIEINTNASFLALGLEVYEFLKLPEVASGFNSKKLVDMFVQENGLASSKALNLTIIDEKPDQQRLYVEFLIYQSLFRKNQIPCEIADIYEIEKIRKSSLVYNRYTDFYLDTLASADIRRLFNSREIQLSPNPYEYFLLADKERFIDWNRQTEVEKPESLLATYDLGLVDKEKIWAERKSLFFKPKNAYGGKQTYKGASASRKVFDEVTNSNFIGQQYSHAPEIEVEFKGQPIKFKYDLRCYAYQDELQMIIARIYQGQTTNLRTEGGGFACVVLS